MNEIDLVEFGKMMEGMKHLTSALEASTVREESLALRLSSLEQRFTLGKGGLFGLIIGLGFAIFGIKQTVLALWGKF